WRLDQDNMVLFLVCFYGIYAHAAAQFNLSLPVKAVVIVVSVIILIKSSFSHSVAAQVKCILGFSFLGIEPVMFILPLIYLPQIVNYFLIRKKGFVYKKWS